MVDQKLWLVVVALLAYFTSQAISYRKRTTFCEKNGCKPPPAVPQKWWLFGIDNISKLTNWAKDRTFLKEFNNLFKESGSHTISMNLSGMNVYWTMSPENAKAMMASMADDFQLSQLRLDGFEPYIGDGVAASNGATWAHGRTILRPSFSKAQVSNSDLYERHFQELVMNIPTDGSTVELRALFSRLTLDVATEIIFGESIRSLQPDAPQSTREIDEAFDLASKGCRDRFNLGPFMFLHRDPQFKRAIKILNEYTSTIIDNALRDKELSKGREKDVESLGGKIVFLDELVKDSSDKKRIRDLLLNAFLGGRDTTSGLLSHVFINLSRHKSVLKKLREEISQLRGVPPTYEQFKDLKYLRWVIDESKFLNRSNCTDKTSSAFRLTPPAPIWDREAKRDLVLPNGGGPDGKSPLFVPKGQGITYVFYSLCHSEE